MPLFLRFALLVAVVALSAGCQTLQPRDFAGTTPELDPLRYFAGHTTSRGVFEDGRGVPRRRFTTDAFGRWEQGQLHLTQHFTFHDGEKVTRTWRLWKTAPHTFAGVASDGVGTARGEAYGHLFHWDYRLALQPGNPLAHVRLRQWMYLQPSGRELTNHASVTKLGVEIGQVTEHFRREGAKPPRRR